MINKIKLPSNEVILYALALAGALTFAYAFLVMDGASLLSVTGILLLARGVVLGVAAGLGMAKISHALPRASKTNAPYLRSAFVAFLIVAPLIISPVTYAQMSPSMMTLPWWIRVIVSLAAGVFVDALTAGVAFASGKLEADEKPLSANIETAKPAEKPATKPAEPKYFCKVAGCSGNPKTADGSFATQAALNAHGAKHKPAIVGYEVSMKPVIKDGPN